MSETTNVNVNFKIGGLVPIAISAAAGVAIGFAFKDDIAKFINGKVCKSEEPQSSNNEQVKK